MPELGALHEAGDLGGVIRELRAIFRQAGLETAALDARILAAHTCALSPEAAIANPRFKPSPEMMALLSDAAARRLKGEPVSRIVGRREFWGLSFALSPHTLDPRPETELLVEAVLAHVRGAGLSQARLRILDLGTGSGCLLGSLLSELPLASGVGVDLSEEALVTARNNLESLGVLKRTAFFCGNWARALGDASFDIVVSNPPYIASAEIDGLATEVKAFDPRRALDGGADGLDAYRAIMPQAFKVLRGKGFLLFETGYGQARAVQAMMAEAAGDGLCLDTRLLTDLSGKERAVAGWRQSVDSDFRPKKKVGNPALSG